MPPRARSHSASAAHAAGGQPANVRSENFGSIRPPARRKKQAARPVRARRAERWRCGVVGAERQTASRPARSRRRPYVKRAPRDGERPSGDRPFRRDDRPREGGNKRPGRFEHTERNAGDAATSKRSGRPPREQQGAGDRPYVKRAPRDGERPSGERPFKRDDRPRDSGNKRPGRFERTERNAGDAATSERTYRPARERQGSDGEA